MREFSCCALRASDQQPVSAPPFSACCRAVRFDVGGIDHLRVCGSPVPGKLPEQVFPDAASRPAHETVIDRRRWTICLRAIAPAATTLEHVHDPADHAPVICPFDAAHIVKAEELMSCDPSLPSLRRLAAQCNTQPTRPLLKGLLAALQNVADRLADMGTLQSTRQIRDRR
jgi:hypothetical protein